MNPPEETNNTPWYSRTEQLIGQEALNRLKQSNVLVVGVGGVGAYAAEMMVRAGIGNITIVDGDTVNKSNINRQLVALHSTVGKAKTDVLTKRLLDINPNLAIKAQTLFLEENTIDELLDSSSFDYVIDAIDTLSPKVALIIKSKQHKLRIISSMGAGAKVDPTKITFADISNTYHCALAKAVRTKLKAEGFNGKLPVVFSTEQADRKAIIRTENERNKRSTTGTLSYMPALFGCFLASQVINDLIKIEKT